MKLKPGRLKQFGRSLQENLVSIQPAILAGISTLVSIITATVVMFPENDANSKLVLILYGVFGSLYLGFYYYLYTTSPNKLIFAWVNAIIAGMALGTIPYFIPQEFHYLIYTLIFIAALTTSVISSRGPAYFLVLLIAGLHIIQHIQNEIPVREWVVHTGLMASALMAVEIIQQLKELSQKQIKR